MATGHPKKITLEQLDLELCIITSSYAYFGM